MYYTFKFYCRVKPGLSMHYLLLTGDGGVAVDRVVERSFTTLWISNICVKVLPRIESETYE